MAHPILGNAKTPLEYATFDKLLGLSEYETEFVERNRAFYFGDHWQQGEGYIGPRPVDSSVNFQMMMDLLARGFVSKNVIKEIVDRQVASNLGNQPDWNMTVRRPLEKVPRMVPDPNFVPDPLNLGEKAPLVPDPKGSLVPGSPKDEEQTRIDEAEAALMVLWDLRKPLKIFKEAFRSRLWAGRGSVRTYVPARFLSPTGKVKKAKDFLEAAERIFINHPDVKDSTVAVDLETQEQLGLARYQLRDRKVVEFSFVDEDGKTFIATIDAGSSSGTPGEQAATRAFVNAEGATGTTSPPTGSTFEYADLSSPLDLNKRLTIYEISGPPLVSDQIVQNNQLVNLALTMCGSVLVESGFAELTVTNVEFEMERVEDPNSPTGWIEKPKRIRRGPGVVQNLVGMEQLNEQTGEATLSTPGVHYKEPSPIVTFSEGKDLGYRNSLEEAHQIHALIAGDATPSGESRITALADFVMFSLDYKEEIDSLGTWFNEVNLSWIAELAGKPGYFNDLRSTFDSKIFVGKLTADERKALIDEVTAKLRSRANAMVLLGIDDPDAEIAKIAEEDQALNPATALSVARQKIGLQSDQAALKAETDPPANGGAPGGGGNPAPAPAGGNPGGSGA